MPAACRTLGLLLCAASAWGAPQTALLDTLRDELQRNYAALQKADPPVYFIGYAVTDEEVESVTANGGAVLGHTKDRQRRLDVTVRVGTPKFDNYHVVNGQPARYTVGFPISLDDDPIAIKQALWRETDRIYRSAQQRLLQLKTQTLMTLGDIEQSDDFSPAPPATATAAPAPFRFDGEAWTGQARRWSGALGRHAGVLDADVTVSYQRQTKSLVTSEGTRLQHGRGFTRISLGARGKAADGMDLATFETFEAESPERLPQTAVVDAAVERVGTSLSALRQAPLAEPYVGPAILSGRAAGVFFHEIFGHRVEADRLKNTEDGQTFLKSVGQRVLPDFLSVTFDPTRRDVGSTDLNGTYQYDDDGVAARRVPVVERGILKAFLLSRDPLPSFPRSNGHGRRQAGLEVMSRQSNLFVESAKAVPEAQLRTQLVAEAKRQGKAYGLLFQEVTGGYTQTARRGLDAFKVLPVLVYRVYVDGRPDELVRGADIVGTPLTSFSRIVATGDTPRVFNGYCGAESGNVPVAAVSPALLLSEVEVSRREAARDRPPLLPAPDAKPGDAKAGDR